MTQEPNQTNQTVEQTRSLSDAELEGVVGGTGSDAIEQAIEDGGPAKLEITDCGF